MLKRVMEITTYVGCKNVCAYCPQDVHVKAYSKRSPIKLMTLNVFTRCIDKLPSGVEIFFAGTSEPWLNPECTEMVRYCYEKGFKIRIYSTLVGMNKKDLQELSTMRLEKVIIHLPSQSKRENICVDEEYLSLIGLSQELSIKNIEYMSVGKVALEVKKALTLAIRETLYENISDFSGNLKGEIAPHKKRFTGKIFCASRNLNWNVLLPNGDVILCCEDFGLKHVLGNLLEVEYSDLFDGKEFKRIQKGLRDEREDILCRYCEYAKKVTPMASLRIRVSKLRRRIRDGFGAAGFTKNS